MAKSLTEEIETKLTELGMDTEDLYEKPTLCYSVGFSSRKMRKAVGRAYCSGLSQV